MKILDKNFPLSVLDSDLHQKLVAHAMDEGKTLNAFIKDTLQRAVSEAHI